MINYSNQLLSYFGTKTNILYIILFEYNGKLHLKFGIVIARLFFKRFNEHVDKWGSNICILHAFQSYDVVAIESEFKKLDIYQQYKTDIQNEDGGKYTEIFELNEILTSETIKQKIIELAGNRISDKLPILSNVVNVNLQIVQEKTRQIEMKYLMKQKELEIKQNINKLKLDTKQKELEIIKQRQETTKILKKVQLIENNEHKPIKKLNDNEIIKIFIDDFIIRDNNSVVQLIQLYDIFTKWYTNKYTSNPPSRQFFRITIENNLGKYSRVRKSSNIQIRCWNNWKLIDLPNE